MEMWTTKGIVQGDSTTMPVEPGVPGAAVVSGPQRTGRLLVMSDVTMSKTGGATPSSLKKAQASFSNSVGLEVMHSSDFGGGAEIAKALDAVSGTKALMLDDLGITVVEAHEETRGGLAAALADESSPVRITEHERVVHVLADYLQGFQDGVNALADSVRSNGAPTAPGGAQVAALPGGPFADDANFTWGLRAVGADGTPDTGVGARVAVLDTGVDTSHPDLVHAIVATESFISGQSAEDGHGHGTHCCGTVAGQLRPSAVPRFGVAPGVELFAGKVLSNQGSGGDAGILAGIQWAIQNGCHVISMSLGAAVPAGTPHSMIFEMTAQRALAAGSVIVAAAGNASSRPGTVNPVGHPANCPSIIAVAALDQNLDVARFSDAGRVGTDHVAIAGPGVGVLSSVPGGGHRSFNGTSMATPHVAGVAAVLQSRGGIAGAELSSRLWLTAQGVLAPAVDVGAGLASVAP